jgi:hypothetical protein
VEFCVTLKGKGKAQKVAAFESLATARMWTGGAGATAVAQGQQWIGRPVRKSFDGVVHEEVCHCIRLQFPADPPEHQVAWRCPIHTIIRHCDAAT